MSNGDGIEDHEGRVIDFGRTAVDCERHRPGFPESFFDRLMRQRWIAAGQRALDLGTGTGSLALGFAARGLDVTGTDIAPELLEVASQTAADHEVSAHFVVGRAEATGQNNATFDLVSAGQCWWWFDSDRAIQEAKRILVSAWCRAYGAGNPLNREKEANSILMRSRRDKTPTGSAMQNVSPFLVGRTRFAKVRAVGVHRCPSLDI
ncbi:MAG: class I SAM-dependent methyltransferase [Actinomycetota bacterium]|nr:class I SAM-dependent methyltransferase [Actinomycetota bacterium]